jgi:predicted metal-dependent hydrolase
MNKKITLQKKQVAYTLKKSSRARRMRVAVYCGGSVVVTAPKNLSENIVEKFIREKAKWILNKIEYFKQFKDAKISRFSKRHYLKYKEDAFSLAVERIGYFSDMHKFQYNKINIKNQKTRWGSCSKKGNLNFNYKILFLESAMRDYIIVHELCHLKEFNHSRKFWLLVEKILPDYLEIKKELKKQWLFFQ